VNDVRLLGTNLWNSSDLIRRGQKTVENAVFVDSNMVNDPHFKISKFYKDFVKTFGEEPSMFEAQGYEAGMMLRQAISGGERSRVGLAEALGHVRQIQGVNGPLQMNEQRELVRPLTAFMVKDAEIVNWSPDVQPAPTTQPTNKKTLRK
jgi:ABC-type branched-subunit amino acid transport system substrate-binding protein